MKLISDLFKKNRGLFWVIGVYGIVLLLMMPLKDKAFLDDFAYIQTVEHLVVDGYLKISEWAAVALLGQVYWGALFTLLFGFSSKVLTYSTLTLLFFGLIAFYFTLRELEVSDFFSTIFTISFLAFPWTLLLAFSFMTDVPYTSIFLISLLFYVKGLNQEKAKYYLLGSVFASICFLVRQTAIFLPISVFVIVLIKSITNNEISKVRLDSINILLVPITTIAFYMLWLKTGDNKTLGQILALDRGILNVFGNLLWPEKIINIGQVSRFYAETINRVGVYLIHTLELLLPILIGIFAVKPNFRKLLSRNFIVISLSTASIIAFILFLPPYSKIGIPQFDNLYFPLDLFYFRDFFGLFDTPMLRKFWDRSFWFVLPVIVVGLSTTLLDFGRLFLKWKLRIGKRLLTWVLLLVTLAVGGNFLYQLSIMSMKYPISEVLNETWLFFLCVETVVILLLLLMSGVRIKKLSKIRWIYLFILILAAVMFCVVLLLPYIWPEYTLTFIPMVLIGLACLSKWNIFNKPILIVVTGFLLVFSLVNSKVAHTVLGETWDVGEQLVETGISPKEIEIFQFAWYPWWYYESDYAVRLKEVGGDKRSFERLKTWDNPKGEELKYTVNYSKSGSCGKGFLIEKKVDTAFVHGVVCATSP